LSSPSASPYARSCELFRRQIHQQEYLLNLADGRVIVEGGEYNNLVGDETNQGAIYDPTTNVWTVVNPPSGWSTIGDSPAIVLPDGTFMMGQGDR
jgi:hypothetical protein